MQSIQQQHWKTVRLSRFVIEQLEKRGKFGQTYDDVIKDMLQQAQAPQHANKSQKNVSRPPAKASGVTFHNLPFDLQGGVHR